jgi:hypothetical protein
MVRAVTQRQKTKRGKAFEDLVVEQLEKRGCTIAKRNTAGFGKGGIPLEKDLPDLYAYCDEDLITIEVKEALAFHKEGKGTRSGRFILSEQPFHKDCYAFGIDNPHTGQLTIDFVLPNDPDYYISTHGKFPKYPITKLMEIRDKDKCFPDLSTITLPRDRLLKAMK